ncbi:uncharacterized protein [Nicotiana sylvestris]|uniref:uncharacterized protein isoform X2 n=1 Tax=Nicotiana sylvestris TaxID=4096 RepID=UPI00388CE0BD
MSILLNQHLSSNFAAGASCSLPKTATNECEVCTPPAVLHKVLHQALQMSQVLYPLSRFWLTLVCQSRKTFQSNHWSFSVTWKRYEIAFAGSIKLTYIFLANELLHCLINAIDVIFE